MIENNFHNNNNVKSQFPNGNCQNFTSPSIAKRPAIKFQGPKKLHFLQCCTELTLAPFDLGKGLISSQHRQVYDFFGANVKINLEELQYSNFLSKFQRIIK